MIRCALVAALLAGCGVDHPDPVGRYRVVEDVGSSCAVDQPVMMPLAYLDVGEGSPGLTLSVCATADLCGEPIQLGTEISDGWSGDRGAAQTYENGRICELGYRLYEARFSGSTLVLDLTAYGTARGVGSCTPDDAIALGTSMPCTSHERVDAIRE